MDSPVETAKAIVRIHQACQKDDALVIPSTIIDKITPHFAAWLLRTSNGQAGDGCCDKPKD